MYNFHPNVYTDVRIEKVFKTNLTYLNEKVQEIKEKEYAAAFIRVYDGIKWLYSSTTEIDQIQEEIDLLSSSAEKHEDINSHPIIKKFEVNTGDFRKFTDSSVKNVNINEKREVIESYFKHFSHENIKIFKTLYSDNHTEKQFISSKGANIKFDTQISGLRFGLSTSLGDKNFSDGIVKAGDSFDVIKGLDHMIVNSTEEILNFLENSTPIEKGEYTVVLSPLAAGVFAHESFGHKSEADFMVGDETMKKEWAIGSSVGSPILSIIDDGNVPSSGYTPFDDEGTKAQKTHLINNGILSERLHSAPTAASLEESVTGNARSMNFEYEPIVRMTTTYIGAGDKTKDELIGEVKDGILVETIKHGSGMSTFTIAPSISYRIRDGKIAEPVNVSVLTGTVFETLNEIDGLSNEVELLSFVGGGCGKMEQFPLPVGFGGPYVRVKKMNVQ